MSQTEIVYTQAGGFAAFELPEAMRRREDEDQSTWLVRVGYLNARWGFTAAHQHYVTAFQNDDRSLPSVVVVVGGSGETCELIFAPDAASLFALRFQIAEHFFHLRSLSL